MNLQFSAGILRPDVLIKIAYLISMWMRLAIGTENTVHTEVLIASTCCRPVTVIEIASILPHGLVGKVPDEAALELGITTDHVPIFEKFAETVAHGVSVLTHNHRLLLCRILIVIDATVIRWIHGAVDVCCALRVIGLLELYGTCRVFHFQPVIDLFEVLAITTLVAHTPDDDAGMVAARSYVASVALHVCVLEKRVPG